MMPSHALALAIFSVIALPGAVFAQSAADAPSSPTNTKPGDPGSDPREEGACQYPVRVVGAVTPDGSRVSVDVPGSTASTRTDVADVAGVPSAAELVDLFNSSASARLGEEKDRKIYETYYKAFVGLRVASRRCSVSPHLKVTKAEAKRIADSFAKAVLVTSEDRIIFELVLTVQKNKPKARGHLAVTSVTALRVGEDTKHTGRRRRGSKAPARTWDWIDWSGFDTSEVTPSPSSEVFFQWRARVRRKPGGWHVLSPDGNGASASGSLFDETLFATTFPRGKGGVVFNTQPAVILADLKDSPLPGPASIFPTVFQSMSSADLPKANRPLSIGRGERLKKLSKREFIERRVIEKSFNSFLMNNLETKLVN